MQPTRYEANQICKRDGVKNIVNTGATGALLGGIRGGHAGAAGGAVGGMLYASAQYKKNHDRCMQQHGYDPEPRQSSGCTIL